MDAIEIKKWVNDPNKKFEDGLKLFDKHKRNTMYDKYFRTAPTFQQGSMEFNLLVNELTNICRILLSNAESDSKKSTQQPNKPIVITKVQTPIEKKALGLKIVDHELTVEFSKLPEELKVKFTRVKDISKSLGGLRSLLEDSKTSKEDRQKTANEICSLWEERRDLWAELDEWGKSNQSNKKTDEPLTQKQITAEIKLRRDYISRAIKNKTAKNAVKTEEKIVAWETELSNFEKLLKQPDAKS